MRGGEDGRMRGREDEKMRGWEDGMRGREEESALRWGEESGGEDSSEINSEADILLKNKFFKTFLRLFFL